MVEISGLRKTYGTKIVLDVPSLAMRRGEIVGLVGNNGAGKTTLLRLMLDLVKRDEGSVCFDGKDVHQTEGWKSYTGAYLDESFLIDYLTPEEFFDVVRECKGLSRGAVAAQVAVCDPLFHGEIVGRHRMLLRDLSKGNMQKVGIAAALLGKPHRVLLDEPFAHLDPSSQIVLKKILREVHRTISPLIVLSSHALPHVVDFCTRVLLLDRGVIVRDVPLSADRHDLLIELEAYFSSRTT
jgi:ABC-2 type transport system ATP-binding protein